MKKPSETFSQQIHTNHVLIFAWLVLLLGLFLTGFVGYKIKIDIERNEYQKFEVDCKEIKTKIETRLAKQKQMLLSSAAMFDASNEVKRQDWKIYVNRLSLSRNLDGVQALGFSLWIEPEQLTAHENRLHKEGFPDYFVKPNGNRDAYTSIIYIEPFEGRNLRAFGYDMYSEPVRRAAMRRAIDNNSVSLSGKVILLQEDIKDIQAGTLMYVPVYQKNKPIDTLEQRRDAIFGWVYSPFRMTDLLHNIILDDINPDLRLQVYDTNQITPENLLYQSEHYFSGELSLLNLETEVEFFGTIWTLHFEKFMNAEQNIDYSKLWITTSTGFFISVLLFFLLRAYFLMQNNANRIAMTLTQKLRLKQENLTLINADLLQFTNVAAHHLQEPTRRIISFVQRLKNALTDSSTTNQEIAFTLNFIEQSALRQRALVRDIQLYLAATQPRGEIELIKVKEVLTKVLDSRLTLIQETQAVIECGQLPFVMIDRPRLYDIFSILLDNALRYNQIDCTPKIRIYGELKNNRAYYYVEDNGIGIASEYHERIFLVFERLQVSNNADSTGIGLAIFRRIIQSCNGSVNVKETLGGGTTIVFDLPTNF
jgi:CHASE1-domain containing sensor protein/nitrogen-specific signal transduction histidine kinase